jgi:ABC-type bacteriocin/lantibiotic exporter with double-glycine peptidase domain
MRRYHHDGPRKPLKASNVYRDFKELVWPRRKLFLSGLILVFINRAASLVMPGSTKYLIDDVVQQRREELLLPIVIVVGIAVVIQAISSFALTQVLSTSAQRLIADMRVRVQQHIGRLPVRYYDSNKTGALVSRIMSDVEGVRNLVGTGLVEFIGGIFTAVIAFALLLKINATLTFVALGFIAVFGVVLLKAFGKIRPIFRERGKISAEVSGRLNESLGGVRIVKGFHAESREAAVFEGGAIRLFENVRRTLFATSVIGLASTLLMGVVSITVMIVGGRLLLGGAMTIGDFFAFTLYLGFMAAPVFQMVAIGTQLTEAFAGLDRMHEVLQEEPEDHDAQRVVKLDRIRGHIRFDNVTFESPGDARCGSGHVNGARRIFGFRKKHAHRARSGICETGCRHSLRRRGGSFDRAIGFLPFATRCRPSGQFSFRRNDQGKHRVRPALRHRGRNPARCDCCSSR